MSNKSVYTADDFFRELKTCENDAILMLQLRDWFSHICKHDPTTGEALPLSLDELLSKIANQSSHEIKVEPIMKDRVFQIVEYTRNALTSIFDHLREKIVREHTMIPIYETREVDNNTLIWLGRKPGRNVREKLSGKPYIKAVNRRMSIDTSENRLLKIFSFKLLETLYSRQNSYVGSNDGWESFMIMIQRWLRNEEVTEIRPWENLPPNNTLLQDKHYRKVWQSWLWLQNLDDDIASDRIRLNEDYTTELFWTLISRLSLTGQVRFVQQPILCDYNTCKFFLFDKQNEILGCYFPQNTHRATEKISVSRGTENITLKSASKSIEIYVSEESVIQKNLESQKEVLFPRETYALNDIVNSVILEFFGSITDITVDSCHSVPVNMKTSLAVINLGATRPEYTTDGQNTQTFPFKLMRQTWKRGDIISDTIDCRDAAAIQISSDISSISLYSLLYNDIKYTEGYKSESAVYFSRRIREHLNSDSLLYIIPDEIDEFSLENIRKEFNSCYERSAPL